MNNLRIRVLMICLVAMVLISPAQAEIITINKAQNMANNWIALVLHRKGSWGGAKTAEVKHIQEFKRADRILGYYCEVKPGGFIIVSLLKGLAPIKAYSETSDLNPELDEGPADLLKFKMEQMLDAVQMQLGPLLAVRAKDLESIVEINHRSMWDALDADVKEFRPKPRSGGLKDVYQPGDSLLSSNWHQRDPYNRLVPQGSNGCSSAHCRVGCVATAGAQIMRYWNWPPALYDWPNMPDAININSPQEQIDAVSHLCSSIGINANMVYCDGETNPCGSHTPTANMEGVYEFLSYSGDCMVEDRDDFTTVEWMEGPGMIMDQISVNRPIQYRVKGHSIICDGWDEGYQVHMNYGWGNGFNMWYSINGLHQPGGGTWEDEYMVKNIHPNVSLGSYVYGDMLRVSAFPYRYFDRYCTGGPATFLPGQFIQFLHNVVVLPNSGDFRFEGTSGLGTRLYTRGDETKGVHIENGTLKLLPDGCIKFH